MQPTDASTGTAAAAAADADERHHAHEHRQHLAIEAATMALYVAVCLLAALIALADRSEEHHVRALGLIWGTTLGLALAHLFAFRLAARWISGGSLGPKDSSAAIAQLAGAALIAVVASIPVLLFGADNEFDIVRLVLALLIGGVGYSVARGTGAGATRSLVAGATVLLLAVAVASAKNVLGGH